MCVGRGNLKKIDSVVTFTFVSLGATCYANALTQLLLSSTALSNDLLDFYQTSEGKVLIHKPSKKRNEGGAAAAAAAGDRRNILMCLLRLVATKEAGNGDFAIEEVSFLRGILCKVLVL